MATARRKKETIAVHRPVAVCFFLQAPSPPRSSSTASSRSLHFSFLVTYPFPTASSLVLSSWQLTLVKYPSCSTRLLTPRSIAKVGSRSAAPPSTRLQVPKLINKLSTAEAALKQESTKPQYSLALLNIVNSDTLPPNTRLSAALAFKNFIRSSYVVCWDCAPGGNLTSRASWY